METIKLAILGCGGMAGEHARRFNKMKDVSVVALCDLTDEIVNRFLVNHFSNDSRKPVCFTDPKAMYDAAKPDAVCIVTPHTLHFDHGMQAIAAGCHVLMEKPMVTNTQQANQLAEVAENSGKIFIVGYNTSCSRELHFVRECISKKSLGELEIVTGFLSQNWKNLTLGSWRQNPDLSGGGQAFDSGAHLLNSLCWSVDSPIAEVYAMLDNCDTPVDINSSISIRFANGVLASMAISGNCPKDNAYMCFNFTNGQIEMDGWNASWMKVFKDHNQIEPKFKTESCTPNENFVNAIMGRDKPRAVAQNGVIQCQLMDAIYASAKSGIPWRS